MYRISSPGFLGKGKGRKMFFFLHFLGAEEDMVSPPMRLLMDYISTFFQFILLIYEAFSHLDVNVRYHIVRLLWFHRPIQKRPATVFQLKPS